MVINFKNKTLDFNNMNRVYLMGILNVTPDSFSDGGKFLDRDKALFHVEDMIKNGADIIDIGGESTRPFSDPISEEIEMDRVIPIIKLINENFNTIISVDTYKSAVADEAMKNGAEIINDISGFTHDGEMKNVAFKNNAACIIMHKKGTPKDMQENPQYIDVVSEVYDFLKKQSDDLQLYGIKKIIIDVGFGFGKSLDDNYKLLKNLRIFTDLKLPVLAGISRKSMIGKVIDIIPKERLSGTVALNTIAVLNGARILRVHDVKENYQAVKVIEKYLEA
jgi:dihydropteroate synthase